MNKRNIPLGKPYFDGRELELVHRVLDSGWLAHGPLGAELEKKFADYHGVKHASAVNSCASALQLAIMACELKGEIILPSFTFAASANAIINAGCVPVFADIDKKTRNISVSDVREKLSERTVGIMPVHYAGLVCDMGSLMDLANEHNLVVVEDSAECIGAEYKGRKAGSFGIGCFSFFPTKNITSGEGGMVISDSREVINKINMLKGHGLTKSTFEREIADQPWLRNAVAPGYNFRMSDLNAAVALAQFEKLDEMNSMREGSASYLNSELSPLFFEDGALPFAQPPNSHVYQMYTILLPERNERVKFIKYLRQEGVEASVHFDPPLHRQDAYMGYVFGDLPVTEDVASRIVTLPMYPGLVLEDLEYVVEKVEGGLEVSNR